MMRAVSSWMPFKYNADGSIDLLILIAIFRRPMRVKRKSASRFLDE